MRINQNSERASDRVRAARTASRSSPALFEARAGNVGASRQLAAKVTSGSDSQTVSSSPFAGVQDSNTRTNLVATEERVGEVGTDEGKEVQDGLEGRLFTGAGGGGASTVVSRGCSSLKPLRRVASKSRTKPLRKTNKRATRPRPCAQNRLMSDQLVCLNRKGKPRERTQTKKHALNTRTVRHQHTPAAASPTSCRCRAHG